MESGRRWQLLHLFSLLRPFLSCAHQASLAVREAWCPGGKRNVQHPFTRTMRVATDGHRHRRTLPCLYLSGSPPIPAVFSAPFPVLPVLNRRLFSFCFLMIHSKKVILQCRGAALLLVPRHSMQESFKQLMKSEARTSLRLQKKRFKFCSPGLLENEYLCEHRSLRLYVYLVIPSLAILPSFSEQGLSDSMSTGNCGDAQALRQKIFQNFSPHRRTQTQTRRDEISTTPTHLISSTETREK